MASSAGRIAGITAEQSTAARIMAGRIRARAGAAPELADKAADGGHRRKQAVVIIPIG